MKMTLDDELQILLLLSSLSNSWENLVVSFSNYVLSSVLSLYVIKDSLHNEDTKRKDMGIETSQTLTTTTEK